MATITTIYPTTQTPVRTIDTNTINVGTIASQDSDDIAVTGGAMSGVEIAWQQSGVGALARTVESKLQEVITGPDYLAGNNSTNDDTAFALLAAAHKGKTVDGRGLIYYAPSGCPAGIQLFNATIRTSSDYQYFDKSPLDHPLAGDSCVVEDSEKVHYWPGPVGQVSVSSDDMILRTHVEGYRHETSIGSPIVFTRSADCVTANYRRVIYSDDLYDPRGLVGGMRTSTIYGVAFLLQESDGSSNSMKYMFTSDEGATWTTETITSTVAECFYPHPQAHVDSSGNYYIFGIRASRYLDYAKRTAAGSWSVGTVKDWGATGQIAESTSILMTDESGWIFYVRDDDGSQSNLYTFTASFDLSTTTAWKDSGIANGLNPPLAFPKWGRIWWYLAARRGTPIAGYEDKLIVTSDEATAVYANGGAITQSNGFSVVTTLKENSICYFDVCTLSNGRMIGYGVDGETGTGSSNPQKTRIIKIGGPPAPVASPALLYLLRRRPPITRNSTLWRWTRGDVTVTAGSLAPICDGWQLGCSTANTTVSQVAVIGSSFEPANRILPWNPVYAANIAATGGAGYYLQQLFYGAENIISYANRVVTFNLVATGSYPESSTSLRAYVLVNSGSGGSGSKSVTANFIPQSMAGGVTIFSVTMQTHDMGSLTLGTDPYMTLRILINDSGDIDLNVLGAWVDIGDTYIPLDPVDVTAEGSTLDRIVHKLTWGAAELVSTGRAESTSQFRGSIRFACEMDAVPTVSFADSTTYADILVSGTIAGVNTTAFAKTSKRETQLQLDVSGTPLVDKDPYWCQTAAATGALSILVDTGR